jgi:hypothetical protein
MAEKKHDAGKRELIEPKGGKRYVKRNEKGEFTESVDQGKSLSQDAKKHAKTKVKPGHGDQGDQPQKKSSNKK